jgi:hypothetical protein
MPRNFDQDKYITNELEGKPTEKATIAADPLLLQYKSLKDFALTADQSVANLPKLMIDQGKDPGLQSHMESINRYSDGTERQKRKFFDGSTCNIETQFGKLRSIHSENPNGNKNHISYDKEGKLDSIHIERGDGNTIHYDYDKGVLKSKHHTLPDGTVNHTDYEGRQPVRARSVNATGDEITQSYENKRLVDVIINRSGESTDRYQRDLGGQIYMESKTASPQSYRRPY